MAEAHWQKWYYDWKIGTVNLKPGDLVLVKADTFNGERKIKDWWEEDTCKVVHQITSDIPSYEVMDQCGRSGILHQNWLLLIASEVGIPLHIGVHHAWDRCTSPTPCKPTSKGSEITKMPQESSGSAVTWHPASKTSLGWINGKYASETHYLGGIVEAPMSWKSGVLWWILLLYGRWSEVLSSLPTGQEQGGLQCLGDLPSLLTP